MNKVELLQKIKALAERGVGGEKINAKRMLDELMKKYNISEQDINEDEIRSFDINIVGFKAKSLVCQVLYSIVGNIDDRKNLYSYKDNGKKKYYIKCTNAEFVEFQAKYKFYMHHFKKELELFYSAFIQANGIFPTADKIKLGDEEKGFSLTDEDLQVLELAGSLTKHDYNLQIENKK